MVSRNVSAVSDRFLCVRVRVCFVCIIYRERFSTVCLLHSWCYLQVFLWGLTGTRLIVRKRLDNDKQTQTRDVLQTDSLPTGFKSGGFPTTVLTTNSSYATFPISQCKAATVAMITTASVVLLTTQQTPTSHCLWGKDVSNASQWNWIQDSILLLPHNSSCLEFASVCPLRDNNHRITHNRKKNTHNPPPHKTITYNCWCKIINRWSNEVVRPQGNEIYMRNPNIPRSLTDE